MKHTVPILYRDEIPNLEKLLVAAFDRGIAAWRGSCPGEKALPIFFRADDVAVPSGNFTTLIQLFQRYHLPLCLAVVPAWLSAGRARKILAVTGSDNAQWCWHQHGRLHKNFEPSGKKQEFGPSRSYEEIEQHLSLGKIRLQELLQKQFTPYFTPPWNRCSIDTARALNRLGFIGVSRFAGAQPDFTDILPEAPVNVDLHTRKEISTEAAIDALLTQLQTTLAQGYCGIMIHHQLMNRHAFRLLNLLLAEVTKRTMLQPCRFQELVPPER